MSDQSVDGRIGRMLNAAYPEVGSDDAVAYLGHNTDVFQALSMSYLFWPKFIDLYGAVFVSVAGDHEEFVKTRLATPQTDGKGVASWVECVDSFNWIEVFDVFENWREPREYVEDAYQSLGMVLRQTWNAKLRQDYPNRRFDVSLLEPDEYLGWRLVIKQLEPELETPAVWDPERSYIRNEGL